MKSFSMFFHSVSQIFFSIYFLYELEAPAFAVTPKTAACASAALDIVGDVEDYFVIIFAFANLFALSTTAAVSVVAILASAITDVASL